jgi:translocation and assembly module TamA
MGPLGATDFAVAADKSLAQPNIAGETQDMGRPTPQRAHKDVPKEEICPGLTVEGKLVPGLSDTERKLVCGAAEGGKGAWSEIPVPQARFNLRNFLQERGYHHPVFRTDIPPSPAVSPGDSNSGSQKGEPARYTVVAGEQTRVTSLVARAALEGIGVSDGFLKELKIRRKRKVLGEILTPSLLGGIEQWVMQRMQAIGYPCPKITSEADPDSGAVVIHIDPGPMQDLVSITEEAVPSGDPGILRRYDAFRLGELFNEDLLTLTENRISQQRILQNAYFTVKCEDRGAVAHQQVTAGPPRFLSVGFGFNTEGLLLARTSWRNTRVGNRLSLIDLTLQGSTKEQRLTLFSNWFHFPWTSRRYWQPSAEIRHQNENAYELLTVQARWMLATTWDNQWLGAEMGIGPLLETFRTFRGSGSADPNSFFTSLEAVLKLRTHYFEYWMVNPRSGAMLQTTLDVASKSVASSATAHRLRVDGEALWNYNEYDPPLVIFGVRGGYRLTASPERPGDNTRLPAAYFSYLGGSVDMRGFPRQAVPGQGAMMSAFVGPEVRFSTVLPLNIEPFVFTDFGAVGSEPWTFDSPMLISPGAGLRWKSPVGTLRTTLARGFPDESLGGWRFYFSFGEEF